MRVGPGLVALALAGCTSEPATPAAKPDLALLTSLPIMFGESFGLDAPRSPLLEELEKNFAVTPVDGPEQLPAGGLLLAVQPQALTALRTENGVRVVDRVTWYELVPSLEDARGTLVRPTTGLVFLPGAMTGLILAGVPPVQAVLVQAVVMFLVLAAAATTTSVVALGLVRRLFTPDDRLRAPARAQV